MRKVKDGICILLCAIVIMCGSHMWYLTYKDNQRHLRCGTVISKYENPHYHKNRLDYYNRYMLTQFSEKQLAVKVDITTYMQKIGFCVNATYATVRP